jgi:cbb3-type cytochrome oxidase subunit 3
MNRDKKVGLIFLCVIFISIVLVYYYYKFKKAANKANMSILAFLTQSRTKQQKLFNNTFASKSNPITHTEYRASEGGKREKPKRKNPKLRR